MLSGIIVVAALLQTTLPAAAQNRIFVPMITTEGKEVVDSGEKPAACALNSQETAIANMMAGEREQRREQMICNPILARVARERARDMAERNYFSHTNPDGKGPNQLVKDAGYELPGWYQDTRDANNLESIAAGYDSPGEVWEGWMNSTSHRTHILGLDPFYAGQLSYGIGYFSDPDSEYGYYWVILTAPLEDAELATTALPAPVQ